MKKGKFIFTIIIFVLLLSVLCTGVYSASQFTISILGNLSIIPADLPNENVISVKNDSNLNVSIACSVENASTTPTATITKSGEWQSGKLAFADTKYGNDELRLKTIKMKMLVTNNSTTDAVSVAITGDNTQDNSKVLVTTLGNAYIAPGSTGEVSVQFSAVYDRSSAIVTTAPEIATYNYEITISKAAKTLSSTYVYGLIKYDDDTTTNSMPTKGFNYYIEYGDNPYVPGTKLRWYVWAKDDGKGNPTALTSSDKITENGVKKLAKNKTYYFISEYVLDSSSTQTGISFQAEDGWGDWRNFYGDELSDYAGSNVREYLNGLTVKNSFKENYTNIIPNGSNVNFLTTYNLTNDPLYALITGRSLESLYADMRNGTSGDTSYPFPTNNTEAKTTDTDAFWLLSYKEYNNFICNGTNSNAVAYMASEADTRTTSTAATWWLRSLTSFSMVRFVIGTNGHIGEDDPEFCDHGVRPAFKIQI